MFFDVKNVFFYIFVAGNQFQHGYHFPGKVSKKMKLSLKKTFLTIKTFF
jgi:hypothetical protein